VFCRDGRRVGIFGWLTLVDLLVMPAYYKQKLFIINFIYAYQTIRRQFIDQSANIRNVNLVTGKNLRLDGFGSSWQPAVVVSEIPHSDE